uniref:Signal recognition particle receptor subunit beta n=1 Tax=Setaria digitata TaxID=48799 RepID=A0A915PYZ8_9BILA
MESQVRNELLEQHRFDMTIGVWIAFLVVAVSVLAYILKRRFAQGNTVLIVGLCDSGKTLLFSKLINPKYSPETYTSLKENRCEDVSVTSDKSNRGKLKGIIFVIDSSTFGKRIRDVAAFLYDILYESEKKIPVLVACNKQNCPLAKREVGSYRNSFWVWHEQFSKIYKTCETLNDQLLKAVRTALEREFGYINGTREAVLDTTDGAAKKRALTSTGKNFRWDDLSSPRLDFIECFVKENSEDDSMNKSCQMEPVLEWIAAL